MEDWLEFDFRQMPMIQNRACGCGQMPINPMMIPQPMPFQPMQYAPLSPQAYAQNYNQPMEQVQVPPSITPPATTVPPSGSTGGPDFNIEPGSPVQQDVNYTQGYLKTQIGKRVRIEFLIGTGIVTDRIGTLLEVGISYVVIQPTETDDLLMCDIYAIKFVTIYQ